MKYPPLPDPEAPDPGPAPEPAGTRREPAAPMATTGTPAGPAPGERAEPKPTPSPSDGEAGAETPIYAAQPSTDNDDERIEDDEAGGDEATDDEFAELIERVDLDDLEDLHDEEAEDDAVEVPTLTDEPDAAPVQAGTQLPGDAAGVAARHRIGGDEPIPMLTEVVQVPRYDSEDLPQSLGEVDWGDLAQRVRENVLERLLRRSDALLDAQLQDTLVPVLERAAETVAHELHDALNRMIRDIVARAVTEELTRLHAEIAKRNRSRPR
jgi:hypothetical protein